MVTAVLSLHDQAVRLRYPASLRSDIELMFPGRKANATIPAREIEIRQSSADCFSLHGDFEPSAADLAPRAGLSRGDALAALIDEVSRSLIIDLDSAVALHAGAVGWGGKSILVAGPSGLGKTSLTAWFAANRFDYLADEIVILANEGTVGFSRPLLFKAGSPEPRAWQREDARIQSISGGSRKIIIPAGVSAGDEARTCALIIFPRHHPNARLAIEPISAAQTGLRLMECNLNARNLVNDGFAPITTLARTVPAIEVEYADYEQLDGIVDLFVRTAVDNQFDVARSRRFLSACATPAPRPDRQDNRLHPAPKAEIPQPTPRGPPKKMTIGMATYDDYDGVFFTVQALRLYHPTILADVEFLIIDNHPEGAAAAPLKQLEKSIPNYRYVPKADMIGTAARNFIFEEASGTFILCIDCHVFITSGAIRRLIDYFDAHPETMDLLQGPLVHDDLARLATHFHPAWRAGMFGQWESNAAANDPEAEPFEIPMQGLGLFACRRAAWPGFNPRFRGFGGEEGYIHEKFRQAGGRTLCLPFLRWLHRFNRPGGVPYPNSWEDRLRNYLIGFNELGLPTTELEAHFSTVLGSGVAKRIIVAVKEEIATATPAGDDERDDRFGALSRDRL